jgi:Spy/CpxP family protein refolding chaperone
MKKLIAALLLVGTTVVAGANVASADPPGPGDAQCRPGQQGNPHPGHQGGSC